MLSKGEVFSTLIIMMIITTIVHGKNYSAIELNRLRITTLYQSHILTRPSTQNVSQTTVAIGIGILEIAGIDPQKQVGLFLLLSSCLKDSLFDQGHHIEC
jgi:hypothetical protein